MAARLRRQAVFCAADGETLYAELLERLAGDVEAEGAAWRVLAPYAHEPGAAAVALRLLAAIHRLVLLGEAQALARFYPSAGGGGAPAGAWPAVASLLEAREADLRELTARPCQTNEVGRAAPLACGFLAVARATGRPLRLLEIGASAGLNLRWDGFDHGSFGDPASPVDLAPLYERPPAPVRRLRVVGRAGCDVAPIDPLTDEGALTLAAFVWPSRPERMAMLRGAVEVARRLPAAVEQADALAWLRARLARPMAGSATVVYHSVFLQYLPAAARERLVAAIRAAGAGAGRDAPVAWVRMEPGAASFETRVTLWPGGGEALVATSGPHGRGTVSYA